LSTSFWSLLSNWLISFSYFCREASHIWCSDLELMAACFSSLFSSSRPLQTVCSWLYFS
jgi:hypothetical protein